MSGHKSFNRLRDELRAKPAYREMLQREHNARQRRLVDAVGMLTALREARGATQQQIANEWGSTQANVSQIEHTPDIYLSTLRSYVEALGGRLDISAVFPDERISLLSTLAGSGSHNDPPADQALTG